LKEKAILVEDEAIVALDIKNMLTMLGYEVIGIAKTGEDAVKAVLEKKPDFVLMDIGLKGDIDGIEAAKRIREQLNLPIIYLTANSDFSTLQRAKVTGPFGYVIKPFEQRELRTTIEMAVYKHNMDKELNDVRQWLSTTLKSIGDGVITTNREGILTFMNPFAERLTGWKFGDAVNKEILEIFKIVEVESPWPGLPVEKILKNDGPAICSVRAVLLNKDGIRVNIEISSSPIQNDNKEILGVVLIFRDITERIRLESELKDSKERYGRVLESVFDSIAIHRDGKIVYANNACLKLMRINKLEDALGKSVLDCVHPDYRKDVEARMEVMKNNDIILPLIEEKFVRLDGSIVDVEVTAVKLPYNNKPSTMVIFRDISGRKKAEEHLRQSESKFSRAFHLSPCMAIISRLNDATIIDANEAFLKNCGYDKEEVIGKTSLDIGLITPDAQKEYSQLISQSGSLDKMMIAFKKRSGEMGWCILSASIIEVNDEKCVISVAMDIPERKGI
jgi:PAS domain S-box-containing protein